MTPDPGVVAPTDRVALAARKMRDTGLDFVIVAEAGKVRGFLSDRDIVVRLVAADQDAVRSQVLDVYQGEELAVLSPHDPVTRALELMWGGAVRRLPVCEGDVPVGTVSLDDLAIDRDRSAEFTGRRAPPRYVGLRAAGTADR